MPPFVARDAGNGLQGNAGHGGLIGAVHDRGRTESLIGTTRDKLMLCDKIFRVVPMDFTPVDPVFLTEVLRISDLRRQIESKVTGTSPTMKNISKPALLGLTFPLPPVPEQQKMVRALSDARVTAAGQRTDAAKARAQAWADFEAAVNAAEEVQDAAPLIAAAS